MNNIRFIAVQDFLVMLKDKTVLLWLFIMPIVFFAFIGSTTGGFSGDQNSPKPLAVWYAGTVDDPVFQHMSDYLQANNFALRLFNDNQTLYNDKWSFADYNRQLWLPENPAQSLLDNQAVEVTYRFSGGGMDNDYQVFKLHKAVYKTLADTIVLRSNHPQQAATLDYSILNEQMQAITLDVGLAGQPRIIPNGYKQAVPGILVMFVMMSALTSGAISLLLERQSGALERLAAAPVKRSQLIIGKCAGKWLLTTCQLVYGMIIGSLLFAISWGPHWHWVFILLMMWAGACAGLAVLMGSWGRSEAQISGIAVIGTLLLAALGGCWWPIEVAPAWMQQLALFLPTGWVMDALHRLMYFGDNLSDVSNHLIGLFVLMLLALTWAYQKFKFTA
ncbi:MAG: ABC transporter permease [Proteobacteria bacterium]|nr:MAG: ABC transporter permease [Pseudomonadota bacterium]